MEIKELIKIAIEARDKYSYSPYSKFKVGAAVEMEDGSVYSGGNIEIASYGATNCAERTAIFKAVSEGKKIVKKLVVISQGIDTFPCGICRQVLKEFSNDPDIIVANSIDDYKIFKLEELLPYSFGPRDLKEVNNV
ncbi:MAG: cytidine deaminase [Peptoniphilaceae bacterium]